ncbi:hypothetical protein [Haloferula sargassicola]|uniref:ABC transporter permease n=1 Tax=Haloferula sargassicola TaxID=490096 RepID=A0ABP9UII2_9BACT
MMSEETRAVRHPWWKVGSNPIFRRYCRSRLRLRGGGVSVLLAVMMAGFLFAMSRSINFHRFHLHPEDAEKGPLIPLLVLQGVILFILGTAQVAGGMTAERDEGTIDYQRLIPMSPLAKVMGYLFGLPVKEWAMFLATMPFTLWCVWFGKVDWGVMVKLYGVLLSSALLYHFTGLVTGTVVKNRRWAFLASIGLVVSLYTIIPQLAKLGLVTFRYMTIWPVLEESLPSLLPQVPASMVKATQRLLPTVKFFNLDFSEAWFTVFSQFGLMLTFLRMLCRRWGRAESHLLGKAWATGFFVWIQVLLLGTALPEIEPGNIFPSRGVSRLVPLVGESAPEKAEAVALVGVYGVFALLLLYLFAMMITPSSDRQREGWRRALKQGKTRLPMFGDPATGFGWMALMAAAGAFSWYVFTKSIVESAWYPGQVVPPAVGGYFAVVLLAAVLGFQALLETRGGRTVFLVSIFSGALPLMVGSVMGAIDDRLWPLAVWIMGVSPITLPVYAAGSVLQIAELPPLVARAVPKAFQFWTFVAGLNAAWLAWRLWQSRRAMAAEVLGASGDEEP